MSGSSSIRTTWKTGTAGPIRINPTHVSRRPTMLTAFSPMRPEELELREQINNFMTDEEKKEYDKWLKIIEYKELIENDEASQNQSLSVSDHPVTTYNNHGLDVPPDILDEYYKTLMKKLHLYFSRKSLEQIIQSVYQSEYKIIVVNLTDSERFILKFIHNGKEKFHISLFTKDDDEGVLQIRGLHFTSPDRKHHLYISHKELENSLKEGPKTDVDFFSKTLRNVGYYLVFGRSVDDSSGNMKDAIERFIKILTLNNDEKQTFANILIYIGKKFNEYFRFKKPGGRVLNSYKSKELKINMIKNKIKLLKKDKIKNKEKLSNKIK